MPLSTHSIPRSLLGSRECGCAQRERERDERREEKEFTRGGVRACCKTGWLVRTCERGGKRDDDEGTRALIFMSHRHSDKNTGVLVQTVTLRVSLVATFYLGQVHTPLDQPGGLT